MTIEMNITMRQSKPFFYAATTDNKNNAWQLFFPYIAHKTLTDAQTGKVTEHAFLVNLSNETFEDDVKYDDPDYEPLGATYAVFVIEANRVIEYRFGDYNRLNNWAFAYALFVKLFGCGGGLDLDPEGKYETEIYD